MQQRLNSSSTINIKQVRILLILGSVFLLSFMAADLGLLPAELHFTYLISRVAIQLPILLILLGLTFSKFYARIHHQVLWLSVLAITYANFWFTIEAWQIARFTFPYEGVLLYALYATFIMRLSFRYAVVYVGLSLAGFAWMVTALPIYGEYTMVTLGFVTFGLATVLLGVNQIEQTFKKLTVANRQLTTLSEIDQLTGIYNRGTFETKFQELLSFAKRTQACLCVYIVDLDFFKDFNDGYGHLQGDKVIKMQADILNQVFSRQTDLVARFGGEEFVAVCIGDNKRNFRAMGQQIIECWRKQKVPHDKGQGAEHVSCSVGIYSSVAQPEHTTVHYLDNADKALYQAKSQGKAQFVDIS